jgi:uncharacterized protein with HEPN domain
MLLRDIAREAKSIVSMVGLHSLQEILSIPYAFEALLRRLTVIGEAARRVSAERQRELPEIPWRAMGDMRNFVVHAYHRVDPAVIWRTAQEEVPRLVAAIDALSSSGRWPR